MDKTYWIWLGLALEYGSTRVKKILEEFGSPRAFYETAPKTRLERLAQVLSNEKSRCSFAEKINKIPLDSAVQIGENCKQLGITVLTPDDEKYPKILWDISDPPAALYCKGELPDLDVRPGIAFAGSRTPTQEGALHTASLAASFALVDAVIVSGGALGIDRAAHIGALAAEGSTVVVMPCGVDVNYPKTNASMRRSAQKRGCLLSEFPPGTQPYRSAFRFRNRILSGLSRATVIVEAGEGSGTLITAEACQKQKRPLFVQPGSVSLPQYAGSNRLIQQGATMLLHPVDVVRRMPAVFPADAAERVDAPLPEKIQERFSYVFPGRSFVQPVASIRKSVPDVLCPEEMPLPEAEAPALRSPQEILQQTEVGRSLSPDARRVFLLFRVGETAEFQELLGRTGLPYEDLTQALTELELFGLLDGLPGNQYCLHKI